MLPKQNRLTSTKDFQNVTKTGVRVYSDIAVIYALANPTSQKILKWDSSFLKLSATQLLDIKFLATLEML